MPLKFAVASLFLTISGLIRALFHTIFNLGIGRIVAVDQGPCILPRGVDHYMLLRSVDHFLEAKQDLSSSFPCHPMLKQGIGIANTNVMVLSQCNAWWQILITNVVRLSVLQPCPGDVSLSPT